MRGDLSRTSAADACRELAREAATGLLSIDGPDGPGTVSLISGRIVAASSPTPRARLGDRLVGASYLDERDLDDALRLQRSGEGHARLGVLLVERGLVSRDAVRLFIQEQMLDALFDILRWRFGAYEFIHGEATEVLEIPLSIAVDEILVEVARRQQEWEQVSQVIPDLESVPNFRDGASSASAALEPDEFAVLASVDGERSVRALASDLGYGEFEAARIVYGLCLLGIVEVRLPEDEVGAAFDDAFSGADDGGADDGDGDDGPQEQRVEDGDDDAALADEADDDAALADEADDEAVVEAELDVDFGALIAEFTSARPSADPATTEDDGEVARAHPDADDPFEGWSDADDADDADDDGPEPFEARIGDDDRGGDDRSDGGDHGDPDEAHTAAAIDWPGSHGWADEPGDEPQPADDRDAAAARSVRDDDDTGPIPTLPELDGDVPETAPQSAQAPPPVEPATSASAADASPSADDDRSDAPHDWTLLAEDPITPAEPAHAEAGQSEPAPKEPSAAPDAPPPPSDGAVASDDGVPADAVAASEDANEDEDPWPPLPGEVEAPDDAAAPSGGGDVSEFLRELSRLALDPDDAAKQRPRPSRVSPAAGGDGSPPPKREDEKPKKRGLFGWGG